MSIPVVLTPEARADYDEAFDWYERQRPGLGVEFVRSVRAAFDRVRQWPDRYATVHKDVRRVRVKRFPYSVLYTIEPNELVVVAVFHGRRDPKVWQSRV